MESGLKNCPFCGSPAELERDSDHHGEWFNLGCSRHFDAVPDPDNSCPGGRIWYTEELDNEEAAITAWNTRAPSDAALVEALEPFARAYERWADGGNLKGWQAERMKQSVDAHRYRVAFEALAAAKGQQP